MPKLTLPPVLPIALVALLGLFPVLNADIVINEYMASNGQFAPDEDGDFEDWIELYNRGDTTVNLEGYGLTDDPSQPFRWTFGRVILAPGEFLIVWASGKDRQPTRGNLHTNFSISSAGEPLQLTEPDNRVADFVPSHPVPRDISRGRQPDGTGTWVYFDEPTPGESNTTRGYDEILDPPVFSHASGFHTEPFDLILSHPDPDVTIVYTTDGSAPGTEHLDGTPYPYKHSYPQDPGDPVGDLLEREIRSHAYAAPLPIADRTGESAVIAPLRSTFERERGSYFRYEYMQHADVESFYKGTVIRAQAVREDSLPSAFETRHYYFRDGDLPRFTLPVMSFAISENDMFDYHRGIYTAGETFDNWRQNNPNSGVSPGHPANHHRRGRQWEYPTHVTWFDASGEPQLAQNMGWRIHGGWGRAQPRKFLRLYARNAYGEPTFGYPYLDDFPKMTDFTRLLLRSGDAHINYLADVISRGVLRATTAGVQKSQPVIQFINGEYWGLMFLLERIDRYFVADNYGVDPDNVIMINGPTGRGRNSDVQEGDLSELELYRELFDHINPDASGRRRDYTPDYDWVAERLDIDSYIDYYMSFLVVNNGDWGGWKHFRFWRVREPDGTPYGDGRWRMIVWDFDGGGRNDNYPDPGSRNNARDMVERAIDPAGSGPGFGNRPEHTAMIRGLLNHPTFHDRFINRFADSLNTFFSHDRVTRIADWEADRIAAEVDEHFERWGDTGVRDGAAVWHEFADQRPGHVRSHLRRHFRAGADATVHLDLTDRDGGYIRLNTVEINPDTPGVPETTYPWNGVYFQNVPITVTAIPAESHRFAGWLEQPGVFDESLTVDPVDGMQLTAIFEELPERDLLHYWNFNDTGSLTAPAYSTIDGAALEADLAAASELTHATGQGFAAANARFSDDAGSHLRLNNPIGSTLTLHLPTTGHEALSLRYETRRSGQGAGVQHLDYSLDGEAFEPLQSIQIQNSDPAVVAVDLRSIPGAEDNPDFAVRITFQDGAGGTAGNNRFDNVTLEGVPTRLRSVFHRSEGTVNFGHGWKWNGLGYLYDAHYPFVYSFGLEDWIYVVGDSEASYCFWSYAREQWAWTGREHYPEYLILSGDSSGSWSGANP